MLYRIQILPIIPKYVIMTGSLCLSVICHFNIVSIAFSGSCVCPFALLGLLPHKGRRAANETLNRIQFFIRFIVSVPALLPLCACSPRRTGRSWAIPCPVFACVFVWGYTRYVVFKKIGEVQVKTRLKVQIMYTYVLY